MLTRALPLLRVLAVVLALAVVVLLVAVGVSMVTGGTPDTPQTEAERSLMAAEQAVRANPEDATARVKLAAAYMSEKRYSDAIDQARTAQRLSPDDPSAPYILGLAQAAGGDTPAALQSLQQATSLQGQVAQFYQDAFVALSHVQEKLGDTDAAIDSMNKAVDHGPENALLLYERGTLFERTGNWSYALQDYLWALEYVPDYEPAVAAFTALSTAHPEALDEVRSWQDQGTQEATSTASGT